jgi:hypothetical protein
MDQVVTLDRDLTALEDKVQRWETRCRPHVADEVVANEMARVKAENSRGGIPLATSEALAAYENTFRGKLDTEARVDVAVIEAEEGALKAAVEDAIAKAETLKSEREIRGTGDSNHLQAAMLEELIGQRLRGEFAMMTAGELAAAYETWTDEGDRTAVRLVEAAITTRQGLSKLRLQPAVDPTQDALAIQALQKRVAERRKARVPKALYEQRARLEQLWNLPRTHLRKHLIEDRRGIALRPRVA